MQVIYHMHPPQMVGEVLYPLNTLRQLHPDIYIHEIAKYQDHPDRFDLPRRSIPKLNCLWNDVVQCSAQRCTKGVGYNDVKIQITKPCLFTTATTPGQPGCWISGPLPGERSRA